MNAQEFSEEVLRICEKCNQVASLFIMKAYVLEKHDNTMRIDYNCGCTHIAHITEDCTLIDFINGGLNHVSYLKLEGGKGINEFIDVINKLVYLRREKIESDKSL